MSIIGIDYGRRRVGLALSDAGGRVAVPLVVIDRRSDPDWIGTIARLAAEYEIARFVVGLPLRTDMQYSEMADEATAFGNQLHEQTGLPVEMWDERFSTASAERVLMDANMSRAKRKAKLDKVAAQVILQSYLDTKRRTEPEND